MSGQTLSTYIVPCLTEGMNVFSDYRATPPTVCPNNNTHIIDASGIHPVDTISEHLVTVDESNQYPNGGNYRVDYLTFSVTGTTGTLNTFDIQYSYNVGLYSMTLLTTPDNIGDNYNLTSGINSFGGTASVAVGTGANDLTTNFIGIFNLGFNVSITDGINTDDLGQVVAIDGTGGVLTFSIPTVHSFAAGATVMYSIPRITNGIFVNTQNINLGFSKIGTIGLAAGQITQFEYTNNSGINKTITILLELEF